MSDVVAGLPIPGWSALIRRASPGNAGGNSPSGQTALACVHFCGNELSWLIPQTPLIPYGHEPSCELFKKLKVGIVPFSDSKTPNTIHNVVFLVTLNNIVTKNQIDKININ